METNNTVERIKGLREKAYRAHCGTSFYPEKRADSIVKEYTEALETYLKEVPEEYKADYEKKFVEMLFSWLSAKAQCISTMIAGPSNFPVRRTEKANKTEHKRYEEFYNWRNKTLKYYAKVKSAQYNTLKSKETLKAERFDSVKNKMLDKIRTIRDIDERNAPYTRALFVVPLCNIIYSLYEKQHYELVINALDFLEEENTKCKKLIVSKRNSIWQLREAAQKTLAKNSETMHINDALLDDIETLGTTGKLHTIEENVQKNVQKNKEYTIKCVNVVENVEAERIQLFFDGKPADAIRTKLKGYGFKWSPKNVCWQRILTYNAITATQILLNGLDN